MAARANIDTVKDQRLAKENNKPAAGKMNLAETKQAREANKKNPVEHIVTTLAETAKARISRKQKPSVPPMVGNQYFKVFFGSTQINFSKVSNIQRAVETETLQEGGNNGYVHVLTKAGKQGGTLTLEKGVSADGEMTKIMKALAPGTRISVPVTVTLYHRGEKDWTPVRSWGFEDGLVTGWEMGELNGLGSEVILERLTITHAGLEELEVR